MYKNGSNEGLSVETTAAETDSILHLIQMGASICLQSSTHHCSIFTMQHAWQKDKL